MGSALQLWPSRDGRWRRTVPILGEALADGARRLFGVRVVRAHDGYERAG